VSENRTLKKHLPTTSHAETPLRKTACKIQAPEKTNLDMVRNPEQHHSSSQPPTMQGEETNDVCAASYIKYIARNLDLR
jgi:hypothetical protein